jgi:hypothetical protein
LKDFLFTTKEFKLLIAGLAALGVIVIFKDFYDLEQNISYLSIALFDYGFI